MLLPEIPDKIRYRELFNHDHVWRAAVEHLVRRHGICGKLHRGVKGSHFVYRGEK